MPRGRSVKSVSTVGKKKQKIRLIFDTLVRAILGIFNAFCLLSFRNRVFELWGRNVANWYIVFQIGQFHLMYYASRTLPNFFAFGLSESPAWQ